MTNVAGVVQPPMSSPIKPILYTAVGVSTIPFASTFAAYFLISTEAALSTARFFTQFLPDFTPISDSIEATLGWLKGEEKKPPYVQKIENFIADYPLEVAGVATFVSGATTVNLLSKSDAARQKLILELAPFLSTIQSVLKEGLGTSLTPANSVLTTSPLTPETSVPRPHNIEEKKSEGDGGESKEETLSSPSSDPLPYDAGAVYQAFQNWINTTSEGGEDRLEYLQASHKILTFLKDPEATHLDLSESNLTELPDIFFLPHFRRLQRLNLRKNKLKDLPPTSAQLTQLKILKFDNNKFQKFPEEISNFTQLDHLSASYNKIGSLPDWISNYQGLKTLAVSHNELRGLTPLRYLTTLLNIDASHNNVQDMTPCCSLTEVKSLDLSHNQISQIPEQLIGLRLLEFLNLQNNRIRHVPPLIGSLRSLRTLFLDRNPLSRVNIPNSLSSLPLLRSFRFSDNGGRDLVILEGEQIRNFFLQPIPLQATRFLSPELIRHITNMQMQQNFASTPLPSLLQSLHQLYRLAKITAQPEGVSWVNTLSDENKDILRNWLVRALAMKEFARTSSSAVKEETANLILHYLKKGDDEDFRGLLMTAIDESSRDCSDKVSLFLIQLHLSELEPKGEEAKKLAPVIDYLKNRWTIHVLDQYAKRKIISLPIGFKEDVEVYLGLYTYLRERLKLNLPLKQSRFTGTRDSKLTRVDLNHAAKVVELLQEPELDFETVNALLPPPRATPDGAPTRADLLTEKDTFIQFLIGDPVWKNYLASFAKDRYEKAEDEVTEAGYTPEALETFNATLKEMTLEALKQATP